jgi:5-(carboxyamino)imidazole ribonucleotide synthase
VKIGILGGGQLARMLALAGYPLGQEFVVLDPNEDACGGQVSELIVAAFDDEAGLTELAERCDLVTLDFENVPVSTVRLLSPLVPVLPGEAALEAAQDRVGEKTFFTKLGIPCAPFAQIDTYQDLECEINTIGYPAILKTRRMGYDGKGQVIIRDRSGADAAWAQLGEHPAVLEGFVEFKRELSIIAVRSTRNETAFYPLTENKHKDGILITSFAPAIAVSVEEQARTYALKVMEALDYVGVLAIEFFEVGDQLVANEFAPRVHNSGHWTIDGAVTSQFENHLRAIMGWPLGSTRATGNSAMMNWIGVMPDPSTALSYPEAHWHDYGKNPRPGRKVGHVTINAPDILLLQSELAKFASALGQHIEKSGADAFNLDRTH